VQPEGASLPAAGFSTGPGCRGRLQFNPGFSPGGIALFAAIAYASFPAGKTSGAIEKNPRNIVPSDFVRTLRRDGLLRHPGATLTPLADGVSSEIFRVDDGGDSFVVKRALPKLRVKDDWLADVGRNRYEQLYIQYVARLLPSAVPALRPGPLDRGYFAMEFLGAQFTSWKQMLLRGQVRVEDAVAAASMLGAIHAHSASDSEAARQFDTTANFIQLRIDPYLLTTGRRHPGLRALFDAEAERLASTRQCLLHGDFSPKNLMISPSRMVLLDCEVAWYGDPAFDLAFLLTHLLLKGLYHAPRQLGFEPMCQAFWRRYVEVAGHAIDAQALEPRVARLLLMLLLARIDGKSPIEYLSKQQGDWVRQFARSGILAGCSKLSGIVPQWFSNLNQWEAR
jgi:aminoglycoside phosphotransferase (APT) family kinase protein